MMNPVHGQVMQFPGSPWLAMSCGEDVSIGDEHTAALVLGEQAEPGGLLHQHLPGREGEKRRKEEENIKVVDGDRGEEIGVLPSTYLPRPVAELGLLPTHYPALAPQGAHTAVRPVVPRLRCGAWSHCCG